MYLYIGIKKYLRMIFDECKLQYNIYDNINKIKRFVYLCIIIYLWYDIPIYII